MNENKKSRIGAGFLKEDYARFFVAFLTAFFAAFFFIVVVVLFNFFQPQCSTNDIAKNLFSYRITLFSVRCNACVNVYNFFFQKNVIVKTLCTIIFVAKSSDFGCGEGKILKHIQCIC